MSFAAIYVPDFPVQAFVRTAPELRAQALAVVEGTPPLLSVIGINDKARQCGVELGMTALQAEERLSASGKQSQIRRRSLAQEQSAHATLLDCAHSFSPRVEDAAADTVLLYLAGLERLFGPVTTIARELARRVSALGLEANVAVAANPDAAMHAARGFAGVTIIPPGKEAECLGLLPVDVLCGSAALGGATESAAEMLETLDRWGVRNLHALAALPTVAVSQRLGQEGVRWQKLARGEGSRPLHVAEPPLTFEEAVELEYPVAQLEPLAFLLNRMLEQLCARLSARALAVQELRLKLQLDAAEDPELAENFTTNRGSARIHADQIKNQKSKITNADPSTRAVNTAQRSLGMTNDSSASLRLCGVFQREIKLPVPMLDAKVFLKLLQLDLQSHPPGAPVTMIWLAVEPVEPRRAQSGLFVPATPEPEKLELTLARLKAVVGRQSSVGSKKQSGLGTVGHETHGAEARVGSPEVVDTHRPDAFQMKKFNPFVTAKPQRASTNTPNTGALAQYDSRDGLRGESPIANRQSPIAHMAMRMLRPPLAIAVEIRDGAPRVLRETRSVKPETSGEVIWTAGPWRTSGEWWTEQAWSREEWDVAVKNNEGVALYRIYRDHSGAWFVEAEYD